MGTEFRHNDIIQCIFLGKIIWIVINISLTFLLKGRISNIPALAPSRRQATIWINDGESSDASLGLNELI